MFIDGKFVESSSKEYYDVYNPVLLFLLFILITRFSSYHLLTYHDKK